MSAGQVWTLIWGLGTARYLGDRDRQEADVLALISSRSRRVCTSVAFKMKNSLLLCQNTVPKLGSTSQLTVYSFNLLRHPKASSSQLRVCGASIRMSSN